jgi:hypothetical protein
MIPRSGEWRGRHFNPSTRRDIGMLHATWHLQRKCSLMYIRFLSHGSDGLLEISTNYGSGAAGVNVGYRRLPANDDCGV